MPFGKLARGLQMHFRVGASVAPVLRLVAWQRTCAAQVLPGRRPNLITLRRRFKAIALRGKIAPPVYQALRAVDTHDSPN